jgi:hypothetical protein
MQFAATLKAHERAHSVFRSHFVGRAKPAIRRGLSRSDGKRLRHSRFQIHVGRDDAGIEDSLSRDR